MENTKFRLAAYWEAYTGNPITKANMVVLLQNYTNTGWGDIDCTAAIAKALDVPHADVEDVCCEILILDAENKSK